MFRKIQDLIKKKEVFQTHIEEYFNSVSHAVAALCTLIGFVLLILDAARNTATCLLSTIIYGLSLFFLFTASSLYHIIKNKKIKEWLRIADHISIFFLIAGTYTPVLILVGKKEAWILLFFQWLLALIGLILKIFYTGKYEVLSLMLYLIMGWLGIFIIDDLYRMLPSGGFWLMVSGGVVYTTGILFYVLDQKIKFAHFIWHLFVMKGSLLHFLMILIYFV